MMVNGLPFRSRRAACRRPLQMKQRPTAVNLPAPVIMPMLMTPPVTLSDAGSLQQQLPRQRSQHSRAVIVRITQ